jgi:hypothetical protein
MLQCLKTSDDVLILDMQEEIPSNECNQAIIQFDSNFLLLCSHSFYESLQINNKTNLSLHISYQMQPMQSESTTPRCVRYLEVGLWSRPGY